MLKHHQTLPRDEAGQIDVDRWLCELKESCPQVEIPPMLDAIAYLKNQQVEEVLFEHGLEQGQLVAELKLHTDGIMTALLYPMVKANGLSRAMLESELGIRLGELMNSLMQTDQLSTLQLSSTRLQHLEAQDQVENIRRLMAALINDPSIAVIKLAERVVALRHAKNINPQQRRRIAQEVLLFFAPLANRLGIWQVKWELEDLAFRYLHEEAYRNIASQFKGRRVEREQRIAGIAVELQQHLQDAGVNATVSGRAKHIFSIWRKMREKNVQMDEVYDVRAVRVIVDDIADCYVALGLIHTRWRHIPKEFDDYIAAPKENGYRSIHTAVLGPGERALEIQIRTLKMHEEAELGLCAHWAYKNYMQTPTAQKQVDLGYDEKLDWLRQVLEWQNERGDGAELALEDLNWEADKRIFVYTPDGHVIDFAAGATPVDFAYRVHTDVGHRCASALVNGSDQSLNVVLQTGQRVEIETNAEANPDRMWLEPELGYVQTRRAREKIAEFFSELDLAEQESLGRGLIRDLFRRIGLKVPDDEQLRQFAQVQINADVPTLYGRLGAGFILLFDLLPALIKQVAVAQLSLQGLETSLNAGSTAAVDYAIAVKAKDRDGLLRDVALVLSRQETYLQSTSARANMDGSARILIEVKLKGLVELIRIIELLRAIPSVVDVNRVIK